MIFIERPVTVQHIRDACARFPEGLRVEYKSTFDGNVRAKLPKVVSSFANSQGGVLVIGIETLNGVPQPPFNGFAVQPREEYPLLVEQICLQSTNPPVLPQTQVVQSDVADHVFLVIEVDESAEAPHAIENSQKVYVRTGNAANPYDLAEVDLIIDLIKRRREPLERRDRFLEFAGRRSRQVVPIEHVDRPFALVSISPTFPRNPLCTSQQAWEFLRATQFTQASLVPPNSMRRVPDGAASLTHANPPRVTGQYMEVSKYGLLFAAKQFAVIPWAELNADAREQLWFAHLIQTLLRLTICAERFYVANGYLGSVLINVSLQHVQGRAMRFIAADVFGDDPEDFRCYTDLVLAERRITVDQIRTQRLDVLTDILSDLTWAFWQSNADLPVARLRKNVERMIRQMGA